jgi:hypothetical protein
MKQNISGVNSSIHNKDSTSDSFVQNNESTEYDNITANPSKHTTLQKETINEQEAQEFSKNSPPTFKKNTSYQPTKNESPISRDGIEEEHIQVEPIKRTISHTPPQRSQGRPLPKRAEIKPLEDKNELTAEEIHCANERMDREGILPVPSPNRQISSSSKTTPALGNTIPSQGGIASNKGVNSYQENGLNGTHSQISHSFKAKQSLSASNSNDYQPNILSSNPKRVPAGNQSESAIQIGHTNLLPFRSKDLQELGDLIISLAKPMNGFELLSSILSKGVFITSSGLKEIPDEETCQILGIQDEWFQYYLKQFLLYTPETDYYEPWEMLVMAIFNSDNKIGELTRLAPLTSERFDDKNPTKILLDLASRQFRDDNQFFLVFCYCIATGCFHPQALEGILEDYLAFIEPTADFASRLSVLLALFPQGLLLTTVRRDVSAYIAADWDLFAALAELCVKRVGGDHANLNMALWMAIPLIEFCLRRQLVDSAEEYIKFITSNRSVSELANDPAFTQEFRRVRSLYFENFEKSKLGGNKGGSAIDQMFGFVKGIVNSTVAKAKESSVANSEEVQWDPVSKRWLINGVIPPDDEPPAKEYDPSKPTGPPPIKKQPPQASPNLVQGKRPGLSQKQKFVAYQMGNQ